MKTATNTTAMPAMKYVYPTANVAGGAMVASITSTGVYQVSPMNPVMNPSGRNPTVRVFWLYSVKVVSTSSVRLMLAVMIAVVSGMVIRIDACSPSR